jgi:DNA-directed RNA polymerase subunit RPC12/RpoP
VNAATDSDSPQPSKTSNSELARAGLALIQSGRTLTEGRYALEIDQELASLLSRMTSPSDLWVRCNHCGYHIVKWQLWPARGAVVPVFRANRSTGPGWEPIAWMDRANSEKGPLLLGKEAGPDWLQTHTYRCGRCRQTTQLSAERRLQYFLAAIATSNGEVRI